jgi:hypothetical protein
MQTLFSCLLLALLALAPAAYARHCEHACYKDQVVPSRCPSECYSEYPATPFQVDNACVDFCLDHEHSLSECQHSCWN